MGHEKPLGIREPRDLVPVTASARCRQAPTKMPAQRPEHQGITITAIGRPPKLVSWKEARDLLFLKAIGGTSPVLYMFVPAVTVPLRSCIH